jgi:hypothetical protein
MIMVNEQLGRGTTFVMPATGPMFRGRLGPAATGAAARLPEPARLRSV